MAQLVQNNSPTHPSCIPYRDVQTDDADHLAQSISGWSQEYEQLKAGRFHGSLFELCLGPTQLFLEQTSHALRQLCNVPVGHVWFGLPFSEDRSVRINGVPVPGGRVALHRGGEQFELVTPDELQFWGIVVCEDVLMNYARQYECEEWFSKVLERPVLGVCVGEQIMFEHGLEHGAHAAGIGLIGGSVNLLDADVVPHMGWDTIEAAPDSVLLNGVENERFYFVHSYAAMEVKPADTSRFDIDLSDSPERVSWCSYGRSRFVAAYEHGPLSATQFHPEKSGDAGSQLLKNWIATL